ncbi:hypothetical protein KC363_g4260 [Hortaea werneckii]|uniref:Grh/CP2 DB domain-containing protein n=1 Tax=Hortaea werneckii TaxID=91943 RepID=A0A3M7FQ15_HORWE|nr:hypothetical protein KC325_g3932 [Hortaea werneckii]KAI6994271.1 hypothetical protein KC359_g4740 [Hortaea werneckii]KAI7143780.1 hypothetical protein KC344_g5989 [Hortaea werneckii]KAI7171607.1 hypothetical protein KC360_g6051 [Hortaea werneckii]KAI7190729.1 hypothetical protein KC363_g4260 [Hortaea werneckii]
MFRNRQSQKPSDELYQNFKANFPQIRQPSVSESTSAAVAPPVADALDIPLESSAVEALHPDMKDVDPTPRGSNEPWNFASSGLTPSVMDPNSQSFQMFASQMPGYYTPTPGGTNTLYHPQAGDLHTPFGMGTPLSMPTSEGAMHVGQQVSAFQAFQPQLPQHMPAPSFHNVNPFQMHQPQGFPPHHFTQQHSYDPMEHTVGESPINDIGMDVSMHHPPPEVAFPPPAGIQPGVPPPALHPHGDKFRYHATLNAPTAMIKHSDEIPITYLNKGQAYTLNVADTRITHANGPLRYRTFVRVSFEDSQQRAKPAACWQLWKEGRGTNEAHHRGGRLQAVEYVDSGQLGNTEDPSKPKIELESSSFDGFCVLWSPPAGASECPISVRFNFLSTDFSHSKGVKGIPVRLCAKTEMVSGHPMSMADPGASEVCYCKVKLFRDHGAERKLSNDVAHVKKTIDKLNQQISQIESGMKDFGKRKRGSIAKPSGEDRPGKVAKHRRTWSLTSVTSNGGRGSAEEDLHIKLMTLQDMFTSTRPASILYLEGDEADDMDLHPVKLSSEPISLVRTNTNDSSAWEKQSARSGSSSSHSSPTPSNKSPVFSRRDSTMQQPTPIGGPSRENSDEWKGQSQNPSATIASANPQHLASPPDNQTIKVQTGSPVTGCIEAVGIDPTYRPPPERAVKPIACFYVRPSVAGRAPADHYYRAMYLTQRTVNEFVRALSKKCDLDGKKISRAIRVTPQGLTVIFDDECVQELPEGQDMTAEIYEIHNDTPMDGSATQYDGDVNKVEPTSYELKLLF